MDYPYHMFKVACQCESFPLEGRFGQKKWKKGAGFCCNLSWAWTWRMSKCELASCSCCIAKQSFIMILLTSDYGMRGFWYFVDIKRYLYLNVLFQVQCSAFNMNVLVICRSRSTHFWLVAGYQKTRCMFKNMQILSASILPSLCPCTVQTIQTLIVYRLLCHSSERERVCAFRFCYTRCSCCQEVPHPSRGYERTECSLAGNAIFYFQESILSILRIKFSRWLELA